MIFIQASETKRNKFAWAWFDRYVETLKALLFLLTKKLPFKKLTQGWGKKIIFLYLQSSPTDYESGGGGGDLWLVVVQPKSSKPLPPTPATWEINNDRPLGVNKTRWGRRGDLKESAYCNFRSLLWHSRSLLE